MFNKLKHLFFLLIPTFLSAQECQIEVRGRVLDEHSGSPISFANIYLEESKRGTVSDTGGYFNLQNICPGDIHLNISHIGCETIHLYFYLKADTSLQVLMDHNGKLIHEITVRGVSEKATLQEIESLTTKEIYQNPNKNLGNLLESISGVSTLRTGNNISKPIVHGLYGNRLTILNNGIPQSGQQWGNDHSPEIDPMVANKITVIKGVATLEYLTNGLGSIVLVEPEKIKSDPHLHGKGSYYFESNGLGNGLNIQIQKHSKKLAWKLNGTLKNKGDLRSAKYYLNNTGSKEANIALQMEKSFSKKWKTDLYFSSFNTKIGILRGSQIGNITDLEIALQKDVPFYTEDKFSYKIEAPYQNVMHQFLKLHSKYLFDNLRWIDFTYAGQLNTRKEFDIRRSSRSDIPALSLRQFSNFFELKYQQLFKKDLSIKSGIQFKSIDNTNIPETGILPLIPDYTSYQCGAFFSFRKKIEHTSIEWGSRYDNVIQKVAAIDQLNKEIIRYNNIFHNLSSALGLSYEINDIKLGYNLGYNSRNPAVNELYSNGLHQGVSGIEEGDPNLKNEHALKSTLSADIHIRDKLFIRALLYYQNIKNYIYLNPQNELRLTIRGAFPLFVYEQTDAHIYGMDLSVGYDFHENFEANIRYSYIRGIDYKNKLPLVFMPSNNLYASVKYQTPLGDKFKNLEIELNNRYVFKQNNLNVDQDFTPPPKAYNLLGLKASVYKQFSKSGIKIFLNIDNLLNTKYRDYLNRQRYFADDLGINVTAGINLDF